MDGEFLAIQFGDSSGETFKIGTDLPNEVKKELTKCMREHADLFPLSSADMLGISSDIACHRLSVDPRTKWVAQHRRVQSGEKAEAATKTDISLSSNCL